jgi:hypothetical protein
MASDWRTQAGIQPCRCRIFLTRLAPGLRTKRRKFTLRRLTPRLWDGIKAVRGGSDWAHSVPGEWSDVSAIDGSCARIF